MRVRRGLIIHIVHDTCVLFIRKVMLPLSLESAKLKLADKAFLVKSTQIMHLECHKEPHDAEFGFANEVCHS